MTFLEKCFGVLAILAFILITGVAKADEQKTITPQEFGTAIAETPGKIVKFISSEVEKTKEYQAKSWADMKTKWPFTMIKGKSDVTQD